MKRYYKKLTSQYDIFRHTKSEFTLSSKMNELWNRSVIRELSVCWYWTLLLNSSLIPIPNVLLSIILYAPFTIERFPVPSTNDSAAVEISTLRLLQHSKMNVYEVKIDVLALGILIASWSNYKSCFNVSQALSSVFPFCVVANTFIIPIRAILVPVTRPMPRW